MVLGLDRRTIKGTQREDDPSTREINSCLIYV